VRARLLDGKRTAELIREDLKGAVRKLTERGCRPHLALTCVGDDPASHVYLRAKAKACEQLGVVSSLHKLPADSTQERVSGTIEELNEDDSVHGVLLQLPIPPQLDSDSLIASIRPEKDVDGFHPVSAGLLASGTPRFVPCTPLGIVVLLRRHGIEIPGTHAVILGRSRIVGRPLANLLSIKAPNLDATVTVCHSGTKDLPALTRGADLLVAAVGRVGVVTGSMVKPGAVVVDVGMNRVPDPSKKSGYRLTGDVIFEEAAELADWITPVPGGVGPMTVAMLMVNTVRAAAEHSGAGMEMDYYV
jgi:methylenetetrahydrofolate dehydrogenase (NADP+)/methenyltetrahydrofolate cyclohydrolase